MPNGRRAIYAGTFDIFTKGHLWMAEFGEDLFDELIVASGDNPDKKTIFPMPERLETIRECVKGHPRIRVESFPYMFLVDYAKDMGARFILRGIRNAADLEFEATMRHLNADFAPKIQTVFAMPPRRLAQVSSSMVRGLVGPQGWEERVRRYVPEPVFDKLKEWHDARTGSLV